MIHIDFAVLDDCQNLEQSFGEICVQCNECGRFSKESTEEEKRKEAEDESEIDRLFDEAFAETEPGGTE